MYLLNTQMQVDWVIEKTNKTVLLADLYFIITTPDNSVSYIPIGNLIPPSTSQQGLITQLFTPDTEGLWEINLVKGSAETYTELSKVMLYVFTNNLIVYPVTYYGDDAESLFTHRYQFGSSA